MEDLLFGRPRDIHGYIDCFIKSKNIIGPLEVFVRNSAKSCQFTAVELSNFYGLSRKILLRALYRLDHRM